MAGLKSLAKDTAIYGLSSIVGRFLNYLLVPLYTAVIPASTGGYGVVSNVYAYTALILVFLTFGMETGFFRFANKSGEHPEKVYANTLIFVGGLSLIFVILCMLFLHPISSLLEYPDHPDYIAMMATCGCPGFISVYSVCLSAIQKTSDKVRIYQAVQYCW